MKSLFLLILNTFFVRKITKMRPDTYPQT